MGKHRRRRTQRCRCRARVDERVPHRGGERSPGAAEHPKQRVRATFRGGGHEGEGEGQQAALL